MQKVQSQDTVSHAQSGLPKDWTESGIMTRTYIINRTKPTYLQVRCPCTREFLSRTCDSYIWEITHVLVSRHATLRR